MDFLKGGLQIFLITGVITKINVMYFDIGGNSFFSFCNLV